MSDDNMTKIIEAHTRCGWQPIETAPRDGSEFLAWDRRVKKMDVCYMRQYNTGGSWFPCQVQMDGTYGPEGDEFGHDSYDITLWQPLPSPPEA